MEEQQKTYNGYTNYETWKLCINIDNDEGFYNEYRNFNGTARDLRLTLEESFEYYDVGYKISDFWSFNEWAEIDWDEVLKTRQENEQD